MQNFVDQTRVCALSYLVPENRKLYFQDVLITVLEKDDSDSTGRMNRSKRGEGESGETEVIQVRGMRAGVEL